jgi:hypothetical protein
MLIYVCLCLFIIIVGFLTALIPALLLFHKFKYPLLWCKLRTHLHSCGGPIKIHPSVHPSIYPSINIRCQTIKLYVGVHKVFKNLGARPKEVLGTTIQDLVA